MATAAAKSVYSLPFAWYTLRRDSPRKDGTRTPSPDITRVPSEGPEWHRAQFLFLKCPKPSCLSALNASRPPQKRSNGPFAVMSVRE